jgi:autotransporter-associated beta strand protein
MSHVSSLARTLLVTSLCAIAWTPLHAVDLYWDGNGNTAGAGATPNGTWGVDSFWNTTPAGTAGTFSTGMTTADVGFFSAGSDAINPFTVTVSGTQASGNLTFQEGTPTLTGGTIALGANKSLTAVTTLNGTATIASALTVDTTAGGTNTLALAANNGAGATDLLIAGPISATSANIYQLRLSGAGNGRIEGAISGHGGLITGLGTWSGNWTIAGNQPLGSTGFTLSAADNKLIMGDSLSDVQSWSGTTTLSVPSALMTVKSAATTGLLFLRGAGGTLDVFGSVAPTALTFGINATTTDASQYGVLKLSGGNATFTGVGSTFTIYGTGSKIIGGAASYGTLTMNHTSAVTLTGNVTLGGAGTNENNFNLVKAGTNTLTLSGVNTFNGTTTINGGTLTLANQNAIQNSTLVMTGGGNVSFSSAEVANAFTLGGLSASSAGSGYNIALTNNASTAVALSVGTNNASTTYAGVLSGNGSLTKTGSGTLTLSGANTFTGNTTVSAGTLQIGNATALGGTANGTTVASGASLQLAGGITIGAEALSLSGNGTANNGALRNNSGDNTYNGNITLAAASRISSEAGSLTLGGNVTLASNTLTVATSSGNATFTGRISGTGSLVKDGAGTQVLSGNNTYTGTTTVNSGTLQAGAANALGATSQVIVNNGGSFLVSASDSVSNTAAINLNGGTLAIGGGVGEVVGALTLSANSTIDMNGVGNTWISFASLTSVLDNSRRLEVWNYTLGSDAIYFQDQTNLASSLNYISIYSGAGTGTFYNALNTSSFSAPELYATVVPEPSTYIAAILLLCGLGVQFFRTRKNLGKRS